MSTKTGSSPGSTAPSSASLAVTHITPVELLGMFTAESEKISNQCMTSLKESLAGVTIKSKDEEINKLKESLAMLTKEKAEVVERLLSVTANCAKYEAMAAEREQALIAERKVSKTWYEQANSVRAETRADMKETTKMYMECMTSWKTE